MLAESLLAPPPWLEKIACRDVIISSSVRLSRNLEDALFPWKASLSELSEVRERLLPLVAALSQDSLSLRSEDLNAAEFRYLCDRLWFSPGARKEDPLALVVSPDASSVFTINEADHLSITVHSPGLDLDSAWQRAFSHDQNLDSQVPWAASLEHGYHTARPDEHGAALSASVLAFIPGIIEAKVLERVLGALASSGIKARLGDGEKSTELSSPYVEFWAFCPLSSTEEEFLALFTRSLGNIIDGELRTRERIYASRRLLGEDRSYRAAAILSSARVLSETESRTLLAEYRAGLSSGLIHTQDPAALASIDALHIMVAESRLRLLSAQPSSPEAKESPEADRSIEADRSSLVRSRLPRYDME